MNHLTDTVKRLEKEKDVQAAEIKKMKGFVKCLFPSICYSKLFLNVIIGWNEGMTQGIFLSIYCKFKLFRLKLGNFVFPLVSLEWVSIVDQFTFCTQHIIHIVIIIIISFIVRDLVL